MGPPPLSASDQDTLRATNVLKLHTLFQRLQHQDLTVIFSRDSRGSSFASAAVVGTEDAAGLLEAGGVARPPAITEGTENHAAG
jgi:hypothetical protein